MSEHGIRQAHTHTQASTTPFGRLPDTVLLEIFKHICASSDSQAAYQSCRDIRDFCNRNMKSVTVELHPANSLHEAQEPSSKTMCPQAAFGITKLILRNSLSNYAMIDCSNRFDSMYMYLDKLFNGTFLSPDTHQQCRRKQLANITSIDLCLTADPWLSHMTSIALAKHHRLTISRVLSYFQNLQVLRTDTSGPLSTLFAPRLQQLTLERPVTPEKFLLFANQHPKLQRLQLVVSSGTLLCEFKAALLQLQTLTHLSVKAQYRAQLSAGLLASLPHLSDLALHCMDVNDAHLLTQLHITRLRLESVVAVDEQQQQQQQQQTVICPLKCIEFEAGNGFWPTITETSARAILPLPQPGFSVVWPSRVYYEADAAPQPLFGYISVAHMKSVHDLHLTGEHMKHALRALVENKVAIQKLELEYGPDELKEDDVAACLAFPTVTLMKLRTAVEGTAEMFRQIFLQCPNLVELRVVRGLKSPSMKIKEPLDFLGVNCNWTSSELVMTTNKTSSAM